MRSEGKSVIGNIGLQKWANKENLKIVSAEYNKMLTHNLHNFSELPLLLILRFYHPKFFQTLFFFFRKSGFLFLIFFGLLF